MNNGMDLKGTLRPTIGKKRSIANLRYEPFGGIVVFEDPATQLFVDKRLMKALGLEESELWESEQPYLSAPCEVHFSITNKCSHCYAEDGPSKESELSTDEIKKSIDILADMGVFQIVFGGGEPFAHPDIIEIANYTRQKGIVPNITTNGFYIDEKIAKEYRIFGQINVRLDGVSGSAINLRGEESFSVADKAIKLLQKSKITVGLNVVISTENFTHISEICKYAASNSISDIVLLRYKPHGRGVDNYDELGLKADHMKVLVPMTQRLTKRYGTKFRMDCSLFPALAFHNMDTETLSCWGASGCDAGNNLVSVTPAGLLKACSFCFDNAGSVFDMKDAWHSSTHLHSFRDWASAPAEPCVFCSYLEVCKGGCHPIAYHETGSFNNADPACPIVADFKRGIINAALSSEKDLR